MSWLIGKFDSYDKAVDLIRMIPLRMYVEHITDVDKIKEEILNG